jgi:hypothetical protein
MVLSITGDVAILRACKAQRVNVDAKAPPQQRFTNAQERQA